MAFKTTIKIELEIEVKGDQSAIKNLIDKYITLKKCRVISHRAKCLKIEDTGVKKVPAEKLETMKVTRGIVRAAFGHQIKARIQWYGTMAYVDLRIDRHIIGNFMWRTPASIEIGGESNRGKIGISDPELINKLYMGVQQHVAMTIKRHPNHWAKDTLLRATECKGPGVTV